MRNPLKISYLLLSILFLHFSTSSAGKNYYDILELPKDCTQNDIKKAYRKLALKYHPDRNKGNEKESSERFREVGNAYEVLSNENSRRDYDRSLRYGTEYDPRHGSGWGAGHHREYRDPFEQFNSLFKNDPFFRDAFKEMDGLFSKLFDEGNNDFDMFNKGENKEENKGFFGNIMDNLGVKVTTRSSTTSNMGGGRRSAHSTTRSYGDSNSRSTYTSRSTRMIIQNGQRITIQSLEKDGNKIEEKYVGDKLIERRINGVLGQIEGDNDDTPEIEEF